MEEWFPGRTSRIPHNPRAYWKYCLYNYIDYPEIIDGFKFLFVGRLMKEKGVDELFSAMKRLIDDGEKCSLMILGRCEESYE